MDLVELPDKCLYEAFIESYVTYVIFKFSFRAAGSIPLHERLQQQEVLVANFVLKIFAHKVGQEGTHFELHVSVHRPNRVVINQKMLLHRIFLFR